MNFGRVRAATGGTAKTGRAGFGSPHQTTFTSTLFFVRAKSLHIVCHQMFQSCFAPRMKIFAGLSSRPRTWLSVGVAVDAQAYAACGC
jgi:hypothetical protein